MLQTPILKESAPPRHPHTRHRPEKTLLYFICKSFDFHKTKNKCDLSNKNAQDVGGLKKNYKDNPYDHYQRHIQRQPRQQEKNIARSTDLPTNVELETQLTENSQLAVQVPTGPIADADLRTWSGLLAFQVRF